MYRVFIVDDEPLICKGLRETIEWDNLGLEISGEAHNGTEAMNLIASSPPHILITDIRMPGMDGISLIKAIREQDLNIKIIIVSGFSDYKFLKEAIRLGVDSYLLKPIDTDELISNLNNLINVIQEELQRSSRLYKGLELLRTNTLNRLVTNEIGRSEFDEKASFLDISMDAEHYVCAVCVPAGENGATDDRPDLNMAISVRDACRPIADGKSITFVDAKNRLVFLFFGSTEEAVYANADEALAYAAEYALHSVGRPIAASRGCMVHAIEDVAKSYACATASYDQAALPQDGDQFEGTWKSVVERTIDYIAKHYCETVSLKQIACEYNVNPSYLGQIFRKYTSESFTKYVNRRRIEQAKVLLAQTNLKVYEVSERVGFTDYHYFLKIFKNFTGALPTDTRC
jgi:two-component system response regulator YesN